MLLTPFERHTLRLRTGWSDAVVDNIASMAEAEIYIRAGLRETRIGGRPSLIRSDIDWSDFSIRRNPWLKEYIADYDKAAAYNNADLIGEGLPPRDRGGNPYELHHIGQHPDSPLAELTVFEHRENAGNYAVLHAVGKDSEIDRPQFEKEKAAYWMARFQAFTQAELDRIYK